MQGRSTSLHDILNIALAFLGVDEVDDYDITDSTAADKAKRFMLLSIDKMQRDYIWKELLTTVELVPVFETPRFYQIPTDCLRPMGASIDLATYTPTTTYAALHNLRFDVIGQELETNYETDSPVNMFYVRRDDNPTKWSSELEECVALCVAMRACFLVTDNPNLLGQLQTDLLALTLPKARELQSKYARNYSTYLPSGFSNLQARLA
jgi:hypothetical protein